ncbi:MAG: hypothetical protein Q9169_006528 [Polycauliona sp. 2 TL-2023]
MASPPPLPPDPPPPAPKTKPTKPAKPAKQPTEPARRSKRQRAEAPEIVPDEEGPKAKRTKTGISISGDKSGDDGNVVGGKTAPKNKPTPKPKKGVKKTEDLWSLPPLPIPSNALPTPLPSPYALTRTDFHRAKANLPPLEWAFKNNQPLWSHCEVIRDAYTISIAAGWPLDRNWGQGAAFVRCVRCPGDKVYGQGTEKWLTGGGGGGGAAKKGKGWNCVRPMVQDIWVGERAQVSWDDEVSVLAARGTKRGVLNALRTRRGVEFFAKGGDGGDGDKEFFLWWRHSQGVRVNGVWVIHPHIPGEEEGGPDVAIGPLPGFAIIQVEDAVIFFWKDWAALLFGGRRLEDEGRERDERAKKEEEKRKREEEERKRREEEEERKRREEEERRKRRAEEEERRKEEEAKAAEEKKRKEQEANDAMAKKRQAHFAMRMEQAKATAEAAQSKNLTGDASGKPTNQGPARDTTPDEFRTKMPAKPTQEAAPKKKPTLDMKKNTKGGGPDLDWIKQLETQQPAAEDPFAKGKKMVDPRQMAWMQKMAQEQQEREQLDRELLGDDQQATPQAPRPTANMMGFHQPTPPSAAMIEQDMRDNWRFAWRRGVKRHEEERDQNPNTDAHTIGSWQDLDNESVNLAIATLWDTLVRQGREFAFNDDGNYNVVRGEFQDGQGNRDKCLAAVYGPNELLIPLVMADDLISPPNSAGFPPGQNPNDDTTIGKKDSVGHTVFVVAQRLDKDPEGADQVRAIIMDSRHGVGDYEGRIQDDIGKTVRRIGWLGMDNLGNQYENRITPPTVVETRHLEVPFQVSINSCGIHAILNAWRFMLGLPELNSRERMTGKPFNDEEESSFINDALRMINLALAGHMDLRTIQAFFNHYGYCRLQDPENGTDAQPEDVTTTRMNSEILRGILEIQRGIESFGKPQPKVSKYREADVAKVRRGSVGTEPLSYSVAVGFLDATGGDVALAIELKWNTE